MAVITFPPISSRRHRRAWIVLLIALFFGLAFAAALEKRVECGPVLLTGGQNLLTGGGMLLTGGQQCQLDIGGRRRVLPDRVRDIVLWLKQWDATPTPPSNR